MWLVMTNEHISERLFVAILDPSGSQLASKGLKILEKTRHQLVAAPNVCFEVNDLK